MNISDREKKLLISAAIIFGLGIPLYFLVLAPSSGSSTSAEGTDLESVRNQFETYKRIIKREPLIAERLKKIDAFLPVGDGKSDQDNLMSKEVFRIYNEHGITIPDVRPPKSEMLEGIDEYKYLKIGTKFRADYIKTCNILNSFDEHGFFINDLRINNPSPDANDLRVDVSLLRLVEMTEKEKERWKRLRRYQGRRPNS